MENNKPNTATPTTASEAKPTQIAPLIDKTIADKVLTQVRALEQGGRISFPKNYSVENALQSAWLVLQQTVDKEGKPALDVCTKDSIAYAFLDMVLQGLAIQKKQAYFIVRGTKLCLDRSYFGEVAVLKRVIPNIEDVFANVIHKDDVITVEYDPDTLRMHLVGHKTSFENWDKPITGAYSVIIKDGKVYTELMSMAEIQMAWSHRQNKGTVQQEFPQEMAKRTVLKRGSKLFINASDDSNLEISESYNRTTRDEYEDENVVESVKKEAVQQTGSQKPPVIPVSPVVKPEPKPEPRIVTDEEAENLFNSQGEEDLPFPTTK